MNPMQNSIEKIKKNLDENAYFLNPHSDVNVRDDIAWLMKQLEVKEAAIAQLKRKTDVLSQQVMELTQEIENVRSDFDGRR